MSCIVQIHRQNKAEEQQIREWVEMWMFLHPYHGMRTFQSNDTLERVKEYLREKEQKLYKTALAARYTSPAQLRL
jgi:hypothetical protein